jgi:hypothetical protein
VNHSDFKGWLLEWIGKIDGKSAVWILMMVYNLWLARNDARESRKIEDPKSIVQKSVAGVEKWMNIHCTAKPKAKVVEHWLPPPIGWSKVNVDSAFRHSENWGGGGVVIRDHNGSFLSGACQFFPHVADAEGDELMACKQGLLWARGNSGNEQSRGGGEAK